MRVVHQQHAGSHRSSSLLPQVPVSRLVGHEEGPIPLVTFTADGKYCLTAGNDKTVRLFNPSRLDPAYPPLRVSEDVTNDLPLINIPRALPVQVYKEGIRYVATALAVNDESSRLMVACNKTAVLIDCITAKVLRQWHGHSAVINDVALYGDVLASASYDATVSLWDARSNSQKPIQTLKDAKDSVTGVCILQPSVRTSSVDGCVRTYDMRKGSLQCDNYGSPITDMSHSSNQDGVSKLATSCLDGTIRVKTDDANHENYNNLQANANVPVPLVCRNKHTFGRYGLQCSFSADASFIMSGSEDGRVPLYETTTIMSRTDTPSLSGVACELVGHSAPTCSVSAHPKRTDVVVTASYDGNCVVWANNREYMRWGE